MLALNVHSIMYYYTCRLNIIIIIIGAYIASLLFSIAVVVKKKKNGLTHVLTDTQKSNARNLSLYKDRFGRKFGQIALNSISNIFHCDAF